MPMQSAIIIVMGISMVIHLPSNMIFILTELVTITQEDQKSCVNAQIVVSAPTVIDP
jgi:uncharacterized membrane protein